MDSPDEIEYRLNENITMQSVKKSHGDGHLRFYWQEVGEFVSHVSGGMMNQAVL